MLAELAYVQKCQPAKKPTDFGRTIVAVIESDQDCFDVVGKIRQVWTVVAGLGRWCDEELGEWPTISTMVPRSLALREVLRSRELA